ncbi:hypothetical protein D9M68_797480 [compost metagenome]
MTVWSSTDCMVPPIRSVMAGPEPRYCTSSACTPAICRNIASARWAVVPGPPEPKFNLSSPLRMPASMEGRSWMPL